MDAVGQAEAELYRLPPEEFVAERDAHVARAKEAGDKDAAKAIGALRRPSRAAWLTNLLVQDRPDEVEGLLGLADTLASAQRSLDGEALRAISVQRGKLVGALARRATALGRESGQRIDSNLERDVRTILESALADPDLAEQVRSGRLVRAERHAGFGPSPDEGAEPRPAARRRDRAGDADDTGERGGPGGTDGTGEPDPDRERREREIATARAAADRAREAADEARERHDAARTESDDAERRREDARERLAELTEELERARVESSEANKAAHTASSREKDTARAARSADTARERAEAALRELEDHA